MITATLTAASLNGTTTRQMTETDPAKFQKVTQVYMRAPGDGRPYALYGNLYGFTLRMTTEREVVKNQWWLPNPEHVRTAHFRDYFGYQGCDSFAVKLLGLANSRASWEPFTLQMLNAYEFEERNPRCLHVFSELGYLVANADGSYSFTMGFIYALLANCQKSELTFMHFLNQLDD